MAGDHSEHRPKRPHAIVFPYPYQGHMTPMMNLAINLASHGFAITYVQTEHIHHTLSKARNNDQNLDVYVKSGLDISYTTISDGFSLEFDRDFNFVEYWESMMLDFPARVDQLVERIIAESGRDSEPSDFLLVADSLYTWPSTIAKKHNLVHVSLWTQPALVFSIDYHLDLLRENGHFPCTGNDDNQILKYIPGVKSICTKDLMPFIQDPDAVPILTKVVVKAFEQIKKADIILCNTVEELESETLSALNQKQPIYAIGPINFISNLTETNVQTGLWAESDITQWLKSKPLGSVLYISFGSIAYISKDDIAEIAHGLLLNQVNFIWVLRPGSNDDSLLPTGFEDNVKDRGLILPWCNQNVVLSSSAVGGFLTHCGWNSILESMWHGVPMICFPFTVDQPTNRKLVVDDWKIGINLCDEGRVRREEVISKINILMSEEKSVGIREETKKLSKMVRSALDTNGSSKRNFDQFLHGMKAGLLA